MFAPRRPPRSPRCGRIVGAALLSTTMGFAIPSWIEAQTVTVPPNLILPNYDRVPIGQQESIEAGAFLARTDDAGANWFNPAGLAKSKGSAVNASATAYEWTSTKLEGLGEVAGRSRINSMGTLFSAVLGEGPLHTERWRFGFSVATPITWKPSSTELSAKGLNSHEEVSYGSNVDFNVMIPAIAAAYAPGGVSTGKVRFGAGLGMSITSLTQTQTSTDRVTDSLTTVSTRLGGFSGDGSTWAMRLTGGVQWDASPAVTLGARIASPSLRVLGSARMAGQVQYADGRSLDNLVFREDEATFDYKFPTQVSAGVAVRGHAGELEADVHYYAEISTYDMYTSTKSAVHTVADSAGAVTVGTVPFTTATNGARSVVNVAVGGSHPFSDRLRIHAGFSSDRSPVPDEPSSIFRRVNLTRFTTGLSLTGSGLSGSLGFGYSFGSGTRFNTTTTAGGAPVETQLKVHTANLLFALSYTFKAQ